MICRVEFMETINSILEPVVQKCLYTFLAHESKNDDSTIH